MIQVLSVTKKYTDNQNHLKALDDISFDLAEGEFAFLVGSSGSGKTTLIKLLIREELPTEGKIYFEDDDITRYKRSKVYALRRKIGVIFQDFKLIPELNAFENVAFAMEAAGRSEKEIKENVPYLLDIVGLANRMDFFPKQLSGGEKQRVAIARAMANNPKLLIADEPTGNLDPDSAWDIVQILSKINNWGTTVLMSTHGSDIVNSLHKRVIRLENGKLVRDDFKGSYDEVDEFSLRVLGSKPETKSGIKIVSPGIFSLDDPKEAVNKEEAPSSKPEESDTDLAEDRNMKIPDTDLTTEVNEEPDSETKSEQDKELESKILAKLEAELSQDSESKEHSNSKKSKNKLELSKLHLSKKTQEVLEKEGIKNKDDILELGLENIKKIADITEKELVKLKKIIEDSK